MRRLAVIFISLFLCGCTHYAPPGENHPVRVVTRIDVTGTQEGILRRYSYSTPDKMRAILSYIRSLEPDRFTPITPDTFRSDAYEIVLIQSDGSKTIYHQIYDEYLQKNDGPWQAIDKARGGSLPQLLALLPSDAL